MWRIQPTDEFKCFNGFVIVVLSRSPVILLPIIRTMKHCYRYHPTLVSVIGEFMIYLLPLLLSVLL